MSTSIQVLDQMDQIRLRPQMWIASIADPEVLLKEVVDNSLDEFLNAYATRVEIDYSYEEGWYRVRDNGRGLPLQDKEVKGEVGPSARFIFTQLFSSGKFDKTNYKFSSGLHGVGVTATNALSEKMVVISKDRRAIRGGKSYRLDLSKGKIVKEGFIEPDDSWWSTEVTFWPDMTIFGSIKCKVREVQLQLAKRLHPSGSILVNGVGLDPLTFESVVDKDILDKKVHSIELEFGSTKFEVMFGWSTSVYDTIGRGAVNLGQCNQGEHIKQAIQAVGIALNDLYPEKILRSEDARYGLRVYTIAYLSDPGYSSQTKEKLAGYNDFHQHNLEVSSTFKEVQVGDKVERIKVPVGSDDPSYQSHEIWVGKLVNQVKKVIKSDLTYFDAVVERIFTYKKMTQQLSEKDFIHSVVKLGNSTRGRNSAEGVTDCTTSNRAEAELFIAEGKSAGGGIIQVRNRKTQAILPLRGKPLNVASCDDIKAILQNKEIVAMVNAIGVGLHPYVKLEHARYGKVVIATDADSDGYNIRALLIAALTYLCPELIEAGMVYLAEPPLYQQDHKFIYEDKDLNRRAKFKRYKGLGSMIPTELGKAIVDPATRRWIPIKMDQIDRGRVIEVATSSYARKQLMLDTGMLHEDGSFDYDVEQDALDSDQVDEDV